MRSPRLTTSDLRDLLAQRVVVFDGAMGTQLQSRKLTAADFGGEEQAGCNENLAVTRPDVIAAVHRAYYEAGADFVETDTFGGTPLVLGEFGLADKAVAINEAAARVAREVAEELEAKDGRARWVAGSMGPTTRTISVTGGITFDEMSSHYEQQALGLLQGGADVLLVETSIDTLNCKAALVGIERAEAKLAVDVPLMLSCTIEAMGTMLAGQNIEAFAVSLEHASRRKGGLVSIGMNCATGPDAMADHVRALSAMSSFPVSCMPNAGLPDTDTGAYLESPASIAAKLGRFLENGFLNIVGGCCGTTPDHVRALAEVARSSKPRAMSSKKRSLVSGVEAVDLDEVKPVIVGERTNVIGSRAFKRLVVEGRWDEAAEIGRKQVRGGAHVVDVCLANPDRDEKTDVIAFLDHLTKKVKAPLMIDSTDAVVIEEALKRSQGKAIVNSINLEDGLERFERVVPLLHRYGAAVVVGCIDEDPQQGMAVTRARKLQIAERSHALLTEEFGVPEEDIAFDALVFPVGTGDAQYIGSAKETIEGVRAIKTRFPSTKTVLGISNVSFGLPDAGREVLNTVFLHRCFEAGLDMAIVNAEKLERITHLDPSEVTLCNALIDADPAGYKAALDAFSAHFKTKSTKPKVEREKLPLDERLAKSVVEGSREGLIEDLDEALKKRAPLDVINGPLMAGMSEVGRLFAANQLIVAEVLQSAEVMKAAVSHLEQFMSKSEGAARAKLILATVRGDVHDIGKNLVDIILSNNGYEVVNLGIKVPASVLVDAVKKHKPDFIGLSGLLVKSAQEMVATADELKAHGIDIPIFVGGAALTEKFTYGKIASAYGSTVVYAQSAMTGLDLANRLFDVEKRTALLAHLEERKRAVTAPAAPSASPSSSPTPSATLGGSSDLAATAALSGSTSSADAPPSPLQPSTAVVVKHDATRPRVPDLETHVLRDLPLEDIWSFINPMMLYARHLGLKGNIDDLAKNGDTRAIELKQIVRSLEDEVLANNLLEARAMYRFYRAHSDGNALVLDDAGVRFDLPRQQAGERRCLSDLVPSTSGDHIAIFVTTCQGKSKPVRDIVADFRARGELLKSHAFAALAIETAEAGAEWLHKKIRAMWGFSDPAATTMKDLFSAHYRGRRYSFGYPACPRLEDQATLWTVLEPNKHLGVELTEGFMMDPEASVSALVFHHPQATYFSVGELE